MKPNEGTAKFEDRSKSLNVTSNAQARGSSSNFGKSTLSASIKTKYIVRSRHNELTTSRFVPVNQSQAKS